jgi:ATP-dependent Lon protease
MLAAIRAGITTVIIPEQNRKDLEEIPKQIMRKVTVVPVKGIDEVLKVALETYPPPPPVQPEPPADGPTSKQKSASRRSLSRQPTMTAEGLR